MGGRGQDREQDRDVGVEGWVHWRGGGVERPSGATHF